MKLEIWINWSIKLVAGSETLFYLGQSNLAIVAVHKADVYDDKFVFYHLIFI